MRAHIVVGLLAFSLAVAAQEARQVPGPAPRCGAAGMDCCPGNECSSGGCCVNNRCVAPGGEEFAPCCPGDRCVTPNSCLSEKKCLQPRSGPSPGLPPRRP